MKKRTLTLCLMSSVLLLSLSVGYALADEVAETGADNSPKIQATEPPTKTVHSTGVTEDSTKEKFLQTVQPQQMSTVQEKTTAQVEQIAPMTDKVADTKELPKTNDSEQSLVSFVGALAILASLMLALRYYIK